MAHAGGQEAPDDTHIRAVTLKVGGMTCDECARTLAEALKGLQGVRQAEVSLKEGKGVVQYDARNVDVEKVISTIEATPHIMGAGRYAASIESEPEAFRRREGVIEEHPDHRSGGMGGMMGMCGGMMRGVFRWMSGGHH
ncbi:MAG: heavy-metal-associated domain-containing protein [Acidobacteria bacterium]|nr:heavy-metal-associated domain-containing protein [Acidobacteriota bacterium]